MNKKYTQQELDELKGAIIKRTRATMRPMNDHENAFVNATRNGVKFEEQVQMADTIRTKIFSDLTTFVKSQDAGDNDDRNKAVDDFIGALNGRTGSPGGFGSLSFAMKKADFNVKGNSKVEDIPLSTAFGFEFKTGTLDGGSDIEDVNPQRVSQPELGFDERFLAPRMGAVGIDFTTTSVPSFRQKSRNLGTASDGVRTIGATSNKPEVGTVSEVVTAECKQIAWVESGDTWNLLEQPAMRGWIDNDLRLAFARSVDSHILTEINAASPATSGTGADELRQVLYAAEVIKSQGYSPNMLVMSPQDGLALNLLEQPGTGDYAYGSAVMQLISGIQRVEIPGLTTTYLMDSRAAGQLYISSARLEAFEENAGKTNTVTVRLEATGVFVVQRPTAIVRITPGFGS